MRACRAPVSRVPPNSTRFSAAVRRGDEQFEGLVEGQHELDAGRGQGLLDQVAEPPDPRLQEGGVGGAERGDPGRVQHQLLLDEDALPARQAVVVAAGQGPGDELRQRQVTAGRR